METLVAELPITVSVAGHGAVTIEGKTQIAAMSHMMERAKRITQDFGPGTHVFRTQHDLDEMGAPFLSDIIAALA